MQVVLDTNFLLIPGHFKVDIFSEIRRISNFNHEIAVLDKSIEELNTISGAKGGKERAAAKLGLAMLKAAKIKVIKTKTFKNVDQILLELAPLEKMVVATLDIPLRKQLREKGVRTIVLRQKKYLELD